MSFFSNQLYARTQTLQLGSAGTAEKLVERHTALLENVPLRNNIKESLFVVSMNLEIDYEEEFYKVNRPILCDIKPTTKRVHPKHLLDVIKRLDNYTSIVLPIE